MKSIEPRILKNFFVGFSFLFVGVVLIAPLVAVFVHSFSEGFAGYVETLKEHNALHAILLTLLVAIVCVPVNTFFGIVLAYVITKYEFWGKRFLSVLIEIPFAVSPVVAGLMFVLLFGSNGFLHVEGFQIVFAIPGILLASAFVTFPFVAKSLIPLMNEQGKDEEEVALSLGASGFQTFFRITLPKMKWGLLYGVVLTNARAMGEFGAVAVVSGNILGATVTMPLYVEILYNEFMFVGAFVVASLLALLALFTLLIKSLIERFGRKNGN